MKTAFREAEKVAKKAAREAEKARAEADEETKAADELRKQPEGANKPVLTEQVPKKKIKKKGGAKKGKSEVKK